MEQTSIRYTEYSYENRAVITVTAFFNSDLLRNHFKSLNDYDYNVRLKDLSSRVVHDIISEIGCLGFRID